MNWRWLLISVVVMLTSCEKILFEEDLASNDPFVNFDYLWEELDRKYSYFDLKQIDWDQVRQTYRAQLSNDMSEEELFAVLAAMMNELRDDHSNLIAPFNLSRYNLPLQHEPNFNFRTIEEFYLPEGRYTGGFFHDFIADGEVAYVRYGSFMSNVGASTMGHLISRYGDTRGMILDFRSNGGGSIINVGRLLERFNDQRTLAGNFITRNGPSHGEFGDPQPFYIGAYEGARYNKPVMVLIDRSSYSATTMFAVASKALPQLKLIGDTTGGGGGLPNGGQLPNGWRYRFSISQLIDLDGNNHAENGVAPDISASFDWNDLTRDEIIDRAIDELLQ